jgi:hypothetical protein
MRVCAADICKMFATHFVHYYTWHNNNPYINTLVSNATDVIPSMDGIRMLQ